MNNADKEYIRLVNLVLEKGRVKENRTGINTIGTFGAQARFDLSEGFPLLTTKKVAFKSIVHELLWFLSGSTNIKYLVDNDVHIWDGNAYDKYEKSCLAIGKKLGVDAVKYHGKDQYIHLIKTDPEFAKKNGELGEGTYGGMWRSFPYAVKGDRESYDEDGEVCYGKQTLDQITKVVKKLKTSPDDRRLIVSAWHPYWVDHCALPPCHVMFQFHTEELTVRERVTLVMKGKYSAPFPDCPMYGSQESEDAAYHNFCDEGGVPRRRLNCQLYQRSCDLFLGVPFNIASYSLLLQMVAQVTNMVPGEFIHTYGDLHLYENHLDQAKEQISREPRELPKLKLNTSVKDIFSFKFEDITLEDYNPHPAIKAKMAV